MPAPQVGQILVTKRGDKWRVHAVDLHPTRNEDYTVQLQPTNPRHTVLRLHSSEWRQWQGDNVVAHSS